jgi:hypothetical protein
MRKSASMVFAGVVVCSLVLYLLAFNYFSSNPDVGTKTSTGNSQSSSGGNSGEGLLGASAAVYSQLGYPKISYNGNNGSSEYFPREPNFTAYYWIPHFALDFGQVESVPVMNLTRAAHLAESYAALDPANYSLAAAEFDQGAIINGTVSSPATWNLWFTQVYHGYWLYGEGGIEADSKYVALDAVSGSILRSESAPTTEPVAGNYTLQVNASQALSYVRALSPAPSLFLSSALIKNGSVSSIEPRIIELGPSSIGFSQNLFNASLSGQERLCWVITLYYTSGIGGSGGTFAVDAQSGELLSLTTMDYFPSSPGPPYVSASLVPPSAQNLTVSQETFQMDVNATGLPHSVPVEVPGVLIARPGSTGSIQVSFSENFENYFVANLSFSNPLPGLQDLSPDGFPPGVSASFSSSTLTPAGASNATRTIFLTIDNDAPQGTYLINLNVVTSDIQAGGGQLSFFLTVWSGAGQWPPPPSVG